MNWVNDLANYISSLFKWWVLVLPWQEGIRVRLGKHETLLVKGIYLKLPVIDSVFIQNIRYRISQLPIQTVTTKDKQTVTLTGAIAFQIINVKQLYNTISNPDATLTGLAMANISQFVATHDLAECSPRSLEELKLHVEKYGLTASIKINSFAVARTYRFIQDNTWMPIGKENDI